MDENKEKTTDIEALIFRPSKLSWGVQKTVIKLDPKLERFALGLILGLIAAVVLWSYLTSKAVVVDATGEVTPIALPIPIISKTNFTVGKILIKDNQDVDKGALVIESTRFIDEATKSKILNVFTDLQELLRLDKGGQCLEKCFSDLGFIYDQRFTFQDSIDSTTDFYRDIRDLSKAVKDHQIQLSARNNLGQTLRSLVNEIKVTEKRIAEIEKRKAKDIMAIEYEELQSKLINFQTQIKEKELNTKSSVDNSRSFFELSLTKIFTSFRKYTEDSVITSPSAGKIRFANLKGIGQVIGAGETLFYISQSSSDLWLNFQIGEADIGKVKKDQVVRIDLSSYPASEYGVVKAKVVEVLDKLPIENDQKVTTFTGYALLDLQHVKFKEKEYPIRSGMKGSVKIVVKHERLLNLAIKKIFSIKDEFFGN